MDILYYSRHNKLIYYLFISFFFFQISSDDIELTHTANRDNIYELNSLYIIEQIKFSKKSDNPFDY